MYSYFGANILGVRLFRVPVFSDARGQLGVLESWPDLGFAIKRVFYLKVDSDEAVRACHSVSARQVMIVLNGGVTVDIDNGEERQTVLLSESEFALELHEGIWRRLRNFAPNTIILVVASLSYADTRVYDAPQADLIFPLALDGHA